MRSATPPSLDLDASAVLLERAITWHQDGDVPRAEAAYRRVLEADPANADALNLLGTVQYEHGSKDLAVRLIRSAIALRPDQGRYWHNLALALGALGDRAGNIAAFRMQCALSPRDPVAWSSLIFGMDLHPHSVPKIRLADRRDFNRHCCAQLTAQATPHLNDRDPDRPLRVGYLSADYRGHSAMMVCEPVLLNHSSAVVAILYSSAAVEGQPTWVDEADARVVDRAGDHEVAVRLKRRVAGWRDVAGLSDEQLAAQIRADRIDIAVDLSGYSAGNRLVALAHKPAPVQLTAFGHITGVGIDAIDGLIACAESVPDDHRSNHFEWVHHAPCVIPYRPPDALPQLAPPPSETVGHTVFGYLGRANKTSEATWAAWVEILHRVPHSRLLLKSADYADDTYRRRIQDYFTSLRISGHRLEFRAASDHEQHLATYNEIDVHLDSFPQGGGVTTCEASLMGVPTIALRGNYLNGRVSTAILAAIGAERYVADGVPQYVRLAVAAARTPRGIADRLRLREQLLGSVVCDGPAYTAAVEQIYRSAWREWIEDEATTEKTVASFNAAAPAAAGGH